MLYRQINDCAAPFISASTCGSSLSGLAELWKDGIMEGITAKVLLASMDLQLGWHLLMATWLLRHNIGFFFFFVNMDPKILQCSYSSQ